MVTQADLAGSVGLAGSADLKDFAVFGAARDDWAAA